MLNDYYQIIRELDQARDEYGALITRETKKWDEYHLTVQQELMMGCIIRHEPMTAVEIASMFHISKSAVSQVLAKLENKDLIERRKNPCDRRQELIQLSEQGKQYAAMTQAVIRTLVEKYYSQISLEDLAHMLRTLRQLNTVIQSTAESPLHSVKEDTQ